MFRPSPSSCRTLFLVLGDQLDPDSALMRSVDPAHDAVWMAEVRHESTKVASHKARIVLFLSAMRHFREALRARGIRVVYQSLDDPGAASTLGEALERDLRALRPSRVVLVEAGEWGVARELADAAGRAGVSLEVREDPHFLCPHDAFARHAEGRRQLRMEYFYREMRVRHGVLLDAGGGPEGGVWNLDADNRSSFGREGPGSVPPPVRFSPDAVTREVMADVERVFPGAPGSLAGFDWPVTREEARRALADFITHRLPEFGRYQDAMWRHEPWLYHSRLSAALNLRLLDPREVIRAAEEAYRGRQVSLASAEGFIRQILGWREYVRGVYWRFMPEYAARNALGATGALPGFYWTGETDMACLREAVGQTLARGYAHHIQRLMVTGLYALLAGVHPSEVHRWYLAVYVDAVEWVELPNTLGMSQYADGGVMASKPYAASGRYLQRMSNYCAGCRFDPARGTGDGACPFTTLYWDFLMRHGERLRRNPRMAMALRQAERIGAGEREALRRQAAVWRAEEGV